ncbi:MAG: DNA primase [Rhizobiales bacterium]|nr:DNA primase [Hyphomicrobiales bacterium]
MRFPPQLLDEIRARLPVSQVVSRRVRLQRRGREYVGLSPFKEEKTPSFTVNDQKSFYHCFSTGEHGDIFKFLMTTEGVSFSEAVERLAEEAGVALPKASPTMVRQEEERDRLLELMAASEDFYRGQLARSVGREAAAYLDRRGLDREVRDVFSIGFAPGDRQALRAHLAAKGFTDAEMARAGMTVAGPDIREPYDRFRNRVMFPIADLRGRTIAFGGRALEPGQPAKYLNSPETPLFHKGSVLFNAHRARPASHDTGEVVVAEGYMDVIAFWRAGIRHAVAPLGTALTEDQLAQLWRMAQEPILCFDGDGAGRRAALRALELALERLQPSRSLRFAFMPDGLDPDDLLAQQGAEAVAATLRAARPLADVLWQSTFESGDWSTPERRAGLKALLLGKAQRIAHPEVRRNYERDLSDRLWAAFASTHAGRGERTFANRERAPARRGMAAGGADRAAGPHGPRQAGLPGYSEALTRSLLVASPEAAATARDAVLLLTLLNHPWLIDRDDETIAGLAIANALLAGLRDALLALHAEAEVLDTIDLRNHLDGLGQGPALALVDRSTLHETHGFARPETPDDVVLAGWADLIAAKRLDELGAAIAMAEREFNATGTEGALEHLMALKDEQAKFGM